MALATVIFLSVLKLIAVQRQSMELQTRQIQAEWLAESAVQRACAPAAVRRRELPRAKPGPFPHKTLAAATSR